MGRGEIAIDFGTKQSNRIIFFSIGKGKEKQFFLDTENILVTWKSDLKDFKQLPRPDFKESGRLFSVTKFEGKEYFFFEQLTAKLTGDQLEPFLFQGIDLPGVPVVVKPSPFSDEFYFLGKNYLAKGSEFNKPTSLVDSNISESDFISETHYGLFFRADNVFYFFNSQLRKIASYNRFPLILELNNLLNAFFIHDAITDREGILWIATSRGIVNLNSLKFQNYGRFRLDLMSEEISAILELDQGNFLFGFNNGIQKFSRMEMTTVYRDSFASGTPQERIINFSQDPESGIVWFSANQGGVGKYFPETDKTIHFAPPTNVSISSVVIVGDSVIMAGPKSVYIAPKSAQGTQLYKRNLIGEIQELIDQPIYFFRKASKLKDGRIVVMAGKKYIDQPPLQQNDRFVIVQGFDVLETDEGLLIASDEGLKIFKNNEVLPYSLKGEQIDNPVYCLIKDSKGNIWLGTDQGIVRINQEGVLRYDESNGLIGNEINRGALLESKSGKIIIGTLKGFSVFFPEEKFEATGAPKIYLESYKVGPNINQSSENLNVSFSENTFEVEYLVTGFNEEKDLWIHYRINGPEEGGEWTILKDPKATQLFFTNLPPGNYKLEMKASYEGENFSEKVSSKPFQIAKPIYLQIWFLFLVVSFLIGLGILINILFQQLRKLGLLKVAFDNKEKEKIASEQQFKNVWDSSKGCLILTLDSEEIVAVNPSFARLIGEKETALPGKFMHELFSEPGFCQNKIQMFEPENISKLEQGISLEAVFPWKSNSVEMMLYTKLIQKDYRGQNLIMCIFRDISLEKVIENSLRDAKEKAEEANRFKSSLLSNISHEIRTPLNGILGGTEHIMMNHEEDKVLISQLDIILQSGERLLSTINSILDMAKIEANKMDVHFEPIEINNFINTVVKPLKNLANRKGIVLRETYLSSSILGNTDKRFLEMILNNIISNAIKYTEEGEIHLQVDRQDGKLLLKIEDTGVGMSEEFMAKIFQPFEQESTGNDRLFDGTGIGLSITKNLIDLLKGTIDVQSMKNTGTMITIKIPI
ncbi:MAG: ATP-binding protein [Algoriphagus sp.]|uniref:sensor histidine kinase n=1 Tax=Algoriphagus sp. TaxID=1872435 RepID=UPI0026090708|nr:ATP-binding protein [Algoriphagus sp.]MDG1278786.1 ATP-binding protein [Algoriphagus sp.]